MKSARAIAAGLLIAFAGPPLGLSAIAAWFAMGQGEFSLSHIPLWSALPASYYLGGLPALIAGILIGSAIYKRRWIGLSAWMALAVIPGLAPVFVLMLIRKGAGAGGLIYLPDFKIMCYLVAAALIASLLLRLLIVSLGLMRRQSGVASSI